MHTSEAEYENGKRGVTMPTIKQIVGMLLLIIGGVVIIAVLLTAILDPDKGYFSGIWGYLKYNHLLEYLLLGILAIAIGLKMLFQKRFMDPDSIDDFKTMMGM